MAEMRYCSKCRKTLAATNFYKYKNGEYCELCKSCLTMHIDTYSEETFLWLLEKFDVPYIPPEWKTRREAEFEKAYDKAQNSGASDPRGAAYNMTKGNSVVFGKYLSQMKLKQWKDFTWADTERLQAEAEEKAKLYGQPADLMQEQLEQMKLAFANGEISEAQYMTYMDINPQIEDKKSLEEEYLESGGNGAKPTAFNNSDLYPVNDNPFVKVDIPDAGADLTEEDKLYLAMKWGVLYTPADWVALETSYKEYENSFDIHNADLEKGMKQLCKIDLKMNQAIDSGDIDSYSKLSRSYDSLRKSLKFTEAQNKDEKAGEFDAIGLIVNFCEKEGGFIPQTKVDIPLDVVDKEIEDNHEYLRNIVFNDSNLSQIFENYLKKLEIQQQMAEAEELGDISPDIEDYQKASEQDVIDKLHDLGITLSDDLEEEDE